VQVPLLQEGETPVTVGRLEPAGEFRGVPAFAFDVPESIPQLGYGSHQFFRYYGKFPSVVGAEIVARHGTAGGSVLDCYAGSGTTLVEAQSAGLRSFGVDINPLAVLASNVKTSYPLVHRLDESLARTLRHAGGCNAPSVPRAMPEEKLSKWFRPDVIVELGQIRDALLAEPPGPCREFLLTAFLGIVRRVSNAYDGEVRPHVNPEKAPRSALQAFEKKAREMILAVPEVDALRPEGIPSRSVLGDNRDPEVYERLLGDQRPSLVVAHPPYLNSFNYLQVFSLELTWAEDFEELWAPLDLKRLRAAEHRAWPATSEKLKASYYADFRAAMVSALAAADPGARFVTVIGDATIRGSLEPVHELFWDLFLDLGLIPCEIWFRTTHYGIGKYAYRHRADYHGEQAAKKDAVLVFRGR
jgi:hypothetical protein